MRGSWEVGGLCLPDHHFEMFQEECFCSNVCDSRNWELPDDGLYGYLLILRSAAAAAAAAAAAVGRCSDSAPGCSLRKGTCLVWADTADRTCEHLLLLLLLVMPVMLCSCYPGGHGAYCRHCAAVSQHRQHCFATIVLPPGVLQSLPVAARSQAAGGGLACTAPDTYAAPGQRSRAGSRLHSPLDRSPLLMAHGG